MPDVNVLSDIKSRVSVVEWKARLDCAATYRLLAVFEMTDLVNSHVTLRIPGAAGEPERLLINPYGWMYEEITASSLITIDIEGRVLLNPHEEFGINLAGFVIHSAVHAARADVGCVIHAHTRAGMAVSAMECGLLPITQSATRCIPISYHDFDGPAIDLDEQGRLVADLGATNFMVLRNHGLLTCGPTAAEAFHNMYALELACRAQVDAMATGTQLRLPPAEVVAKSVHLYQPGTRRPFGLKKWPTMLRYLDRRDSSWRS